MKSIFDDFGCRVSPTGIQIVDAQVQSAFWMEPTGRKQPKESRLRRVFVQSKDSDSEVFSLRAKCPAAFAEFALLDGSDESLLGFLSRFGLLTSETHFDVITPALYGSCNFPSRTYISAEHADRLGVLAAGEKVSDVAGIQRRFNSLFRIWSLVSEGNQTELQSILPWQPTNKWDRLIVTGPDAVIEVDLSLRGNKQLIKGGILPIAMTYLSESVNLILRETSTFTLIPQPTKKDPGAVRLCVAPRNLLGALALQFADVITRNKELRRCLLCQKPFEVSLDANRKHKEYCSDACRMKAYRDRKEEARKLAAAGKPVAFIVDKLESDTKTVKGWIKSAKRRRK